MVRSTRKDLNDAYIPRRGKVKRTLWRGSTSHRNVTVKPPTGTSRKDPLAESETLKFLTEGSVPQNAATFMMGVLSVRDFVAVARVLNLTPQQLEVVEVVDVEPLPQEISEVTTDRRRRTENMRVQQLGNNPRKVRSEARTALQSDYYMSLSGKRDTSVFNTGSARVSGYLASIILIFIVRDRSCLPVTNTTKVCSGCGKAGAVDRVEGGSSDTQTLFIR